MNGLLHSDESPAVVTAHRGKKVGAAPSLSLLEFHSTRRHWVELSVPCVYEAIDQLDEFFVGHLEDLQEDVLEPVRIAMRELVMNAIEWGGRFDTTKRVRVSIFRGERAVVCRIADPGSGFHGDNLSHAAVGNPDDRPCDHMAVREQKGLRPGGFGLRIIMESIDELIYNEVGNEVIFIKYTDPRLSRRTSTSAS